MKSRRRRKEKKWSGRNNGPSRQHYWQYGVLEEHKVKALMLHNGMTRAEARKFWREVRKGRMK